MSNTIEPSRRELTLLYIPLIIILKLSEILQQITLISFFWGGYKLYKQLNGSLAGIIVCFPRLLFVLVSLLTPEHHASLPVVWNIQHRAQLWLKGALKPFETCALLNLPGTMKPIEYRMSEGHKPRLAGTFRTLFERGISNGISTQV